MCSGIWETLAYSRNVRVFVFGRNSLVKDCLFILVIDVPHKDAILLSTNQKSSQTQKEKKIYVKWRLTEPYSLKKTQKKLYVYAIHT